MSEEDKENQNTPSNNKVKESVDSISLTGLTINDLLNPDLLKNLKSEEFNITPFLIGIDVNRQTVITVGHNDFKEVERKILHIETRSQGKNESHFNHIKEALKKMVK